MLIPYKTMSYGFFALNNKKQINPKGICEADDTYSENELNVIRCNQLQTLSRLVRRLKHLGDNHASSH